MPALPAVPNVVRLTFIQTLDDDLDVINRFYQKYSGAPGTLAPADAVAWCSTAAAAWSAHIAPSVASNLHLTQVLLEDLSSSVGAVGAFNPVGAVGANPPGLTAGTALVTSAKILRRYRGGHPRQYQAGIPPLATFNSQEWTAAFVNAWTTAYTAFRAAVAAGAPGALLPVTDVNVSYFLGFTNHLYPSGRERPIPTLRPVPVVDQIASFSTNKKVASQRRRNKQSL